MKRISVVIPAFNEATNIVATVREILSVLSALGYGDSCEVIVVDDHSSDDLAGAVETLSDKAVRCVRLSRRSGSHIALRAGLACAGGEAVLCISADGQDDASAIPAMTQLWKDGDHVVWALRKRRDEPFMQRLLAVVFYRLIRKLAGADRNDIDLARADFFLLDRSVVDAINTCREQNTSLMGLIDWLGFRQGAVEYDRRSRRSGGSKWNFRSRVGLAWNWIVAFSGVPLRVITFIGLVTASLGFAYAIFLFFYAFFGTTLPGFASTVVLMLVLGGLQMIMLGLIGEYLWRNIGESRRRPLYFVERETCGTPRDRK